MLFRCDDDFIVDGINSRVLDVEHAQETHKKNKITSNFKLKCLDNSIHTHIHIHIYTHTHEMQKKSERAKLMTHQNKIIDVTQTMGCLLCLFEKEINA